MEPIDNLIARLDRVKKTGDCRWMARCSGHTDSTASLSIKMLNDGRILIHCFAGCIPVEILEKIGLTMGDLFPGERKTIVREGPSPDAIEWAHWIHVFAEHDRQNGIPISSGDEVAITKAESIFDQIPIPPKPAGKPKLAPFSKTLTERQRYKNLPFLVIVCVGVNAWDRAKQWSASINDIIGLVLPDAWPDAYVWPISGCNAIIERDYSPGDDVTIKLAQKLLQSGAECVVIKTLGIGIEKMYHPEAKDVAA